ncbi:alpha/beta fold hydrolase [Corallococcus sp. AB049A]|uniref:Alpha/beta fold hydrolase n=1 Tax=Corallococcus interemptor TaxID=2316720 RepID=A0A3A8QVQ3_9BACT|nr:MULTISPECIES: alpha/beta hydrolase [Corallococcus]RKH51880.1 alpha/beta fold hydrolase [Corallococcus sp. AB050B]RKH71030.1 alpha/beta fold hydrolase [Corallococcus interemptor]RKI71577.1 alpha/beta fold hydrolase [Corallococcus sp. AB049A]
MARTTPHPIHCADGFELQATLHMPEGPVRGVVLVHPATAMPEQMYFAFASRLTDEGFAAVTYNYRGVQPAGAARRTHAGFLTWADQDVDAVTRWAADRYPGLPVMAVGHSFGGHAIALSESSQRLTAAVMVASQAGSLRFIRHWRERLLVTLYLKLIGPLCARFLGYMPYARLGLGEDVPAQTILEWSRWTSLPRFYFDDPQLDAVGRFGRLRMPVLAIGLDDDPWAPPEAIDLVCEHLTGCTVERRQLSPKDSAGQGIAHLGFFREHHAATLWPRVVDWLSRHAPIRA